PPRISCTFDRHFPGVFPCLLNNLPIKVPSGAIYCNICVRVVVLPVTINGREGWENKRCLRRTGDQDWGGEEDEEEQRSEEGGQFWDEG
ncbi:MAG: hypothetical protein ACRC9V_13780, partial [Aeromonas sp.]